MQEEYWRPDCLDQGHLEERRETDQGRVGAALGEDVEEELSAAYGREVGRREGWLEEGRQEWEEVRVRHTKV